MELGLKGARDLVYWRAMELQPERDSDSTGNEHNQVHTITTTATHHIEFHRFVLPALAVLVLHSSLK